MQVLDRAMLWCWPFPPQTTISELERMNALCPHLSFSRSGTGEFPSFVSVEVVAPVSVSPPMITKAPKSVYFVRLGAVVVPVDVVAVVKVVVIVVVVPVVVVIVVVGRQFSQ